MKKAKKCLKCSKFFDEKDMYEVPAQGNFLFNIITKNKSDLICKGCLNK